MKKLEIEIQKMVDTQRDRLLQSARSIVANLTLDDILQPQDYVELETNAEFRFEEGYLMGLESALAAIRANARSTLLAD
jgi:hypothetical protein